MVLCVKNLSKAYGSNKVFEQFNLELKQGVHGLLGPNGAGKTTLINLLMGILEPEKGTISYDGLDIKKNRKEYLQFIGYMPQTPTFYKHFTVDEFLRYMGILKNVSNLKKKQEEVLEDVHLIEHRNKKVKSLSGGMIQRLGIAQAIINEPRILILDEPTAGLDPSERIRFRNLITKVAADRMVILATHIIQDIEHVAEEVIILDQGKLKIQGTIEHLLESIKGNVYFQRVGKEELIEIMNKYIVRNVKKDGNGYEVIYLSDNQPSNGKLVKKVSLEDIYLIKTQKEAHG